MCLFAEMGGGGVGGDGDGRTDANREEYILLKSHHQMRVALFQFKIQHKINLFSTAHIPLKLSFNLW